MLGTLNIHEESHNIFLDIYSFSFLVEPQANEKMKNKVYYYYSEFIVKSAVTCVDSQIWLNVIGKACLTFGVLYIYCTKSSNGWALR